MKAFWVPALVALALGAPGAAAPSAVLRGYTAVDSQRERLIESQFMDIPTAQNALETATAIGARPHYAGTPADYALAVYMRDHLRTYGIRAELESFTAWVDTPRELVLELAPPADLVPPAGFAASRNRKAAFPIAINLAERGEPTDSPTNARTIGLPFNAGSGDGDVSAPLVYVSRGFAADYDTLATAGVDVRGAVVLVRYGAQFRGILAERAQTRGVAGIIFYSDPDDDGFAKGLVYPNGPWRPLASVERGWVGPAIHIPTLPISAANAQILLGALRGIDGPPGWGGALPVAYPLARGPGRVHLIVKLNRKPTTLWNTIGSVPGVHGNQRVILGAHRDAWVYGVGDDGAGIATVLEVARGLGFLVQGGWRPQRTIVIAGWDGEEIGLAGSRAYVQQHRFDLAQGCFAYLNADANVSGPAFGADAVAAIAPLIADVAGAVRDPSWPATSVYDSWAAQTPRIVPRADPPGGGSDSEPFLAEAGAPVGAMRFRGPFGAYHSSYDTLAYATRISDPDFAFHRAAAQLYGLLTLRLADAAGSPYAFGGYAPLFRSGVTHIAQRAQQIGLAFDSTALRRAIDRLALVASVFDSAVAPADDAGATRALGAARTLDSLAYGVNGYASLALPDIDAAVTARDPDRITRAIARGTAAITAATNALAP